MWWMLEHVFGLIQKIIKLKQFIDFGNWTLLRQNIRDRTKASIYDASNNKH